MIAASMTLANKGFEWLAIEGLQLKEATPTDNASNKHTGNTIAET